MLEIGLVRYMDPDVYTRNMTYWVPGPADTEVRSNRVPPTMMNKSVRVLFTRTVTAHEFIAVHTFVKLVCPDAYGIDPYATTKCMMVSLREAILEAKLIMDILRAPE
jgi:hypothetical protein